jgi:hypothetical protein
MTMHRFAFVLLISICSCAKREEPPPQQAPAPLATGPAKVHLTKNGQPVFKVMVSPQAGKLAAQEPAAPAASASGSASK